ncbi:MAG: tyrosine-type recombinase/integrase [Anaerolineaceae bacterium]|nr:tyrosine-type recombinase/integrase [Anaerolineaceae bacterium]
MGTTQQDQVTFSTLVNQVLAGTVANVANGFLVDAQSRGLSPNTLRGYGNEIKSLIQWLDLQGVIMIEEMTADVIRKYMLSLKEHRNPGGQFAGYRVLRQMTYWWERETDDQYKSPIRKVKPPKVNSQPLPGIKQEEIQTLLKACTGLTGQRDRAVIHFLADTGVRAAECCDLRISDLDLINNSAVIQKGKGGKRRIVYYGQKTRRELRKYLNSRSSARTQDALFATDEGQPLTFHGLRQIVRRRAQQAGIPEPGLHDFRRFFALTMLRNGADLISLARLMGHSGITVLQRYLAQVTEDLQAVHVKASPLDRA